MPFLNILMTNGNILLLLSLRKLREAAQLKHYAVHLEQEGLQELELAMGGTPASQLVDMVSAGVNEAGGLAPPSPRFHPLV